MQRSIIMTKGLASSSRVLRRSSRALPSNPTSSPCDVFINHRGVDTKKTIAGLLYQQLSSFGRNPFLDNKSMKPGDKLFEKIDPAIKCSKVGVVVFSPRYCESFFCLHELALMMESKKKVVPIFWNVKPSEIRINQDIQRFHRAVEEAKDIVGLTFQTSTGDWSEFLTNATDAVLRILLEVEAEEDGKCLNHRITKYYDANSAKSSI